MAGRLNGKVAVITGGGDGIGRATALLMAAEGASVVVNDIGKDDEGKNLADKVAAEITGSRGKAAANHDSVATVIGGENIISTALKNFGRVDILVNNAGNFLKVPTVEMTEEQWDSIINVHLKGSYSCARPAIEAMLKQQSGRIINISSRASFFGPEVAYATAKAGLLGFTTSLSLELKDKGITVNAILPSAKTKLFPMETISISPELPPKKRMGPEYVAPLITYLATDEANDITGRFFLIGSGDFCVYAKLLRVPGGAHTMLYKQDMWTLDELTQILPPLMGNG